MLSLQISSDVDDDNAAGNFEKKKEGPKKRSLYKYMKEENAKAMAMSSSQQRQKGPSAHACIHCNDPTDPFEKPSSPEQQGPFDKGMITSETPLPCDHASAKPSSPQQQGLLDEHKIPLLGDKAYADLLSQMQQSRYTFRHDHQKCIEMRRPRPINLFEAQDFVKLGMPPMPTFLPKVEYVPPLAPSTSVLAKRKDLSTESMANDSIRFIPQLKDEEIKNIIAGVYDAEGALESAFWSRLKKN